MPTTDPLDTANDRPDALTGPWRAVLACEDGFVVTLGELDPSDVASVRIVRGRDMPVRFDDNDPDDHTERLPGTRTTGVLDTVLLFEDLYVEMDDVAGRWAQAQTIAALLNGRNGINDLPGVSLPAAADV